MKIEFRLASLAAALMLLAGPAWSSDRDELEAMLHRFLSTSDKLAAHESFWADDLVYTSSAGLRFGKADILASFASGDEATSAEPPEMLYSGEEVDIRVYNDTAIVAFKLVGTPTDKAASPDVLYYFNTGTFLKRGGVWQAVAWQATIIPPP